MCKFYIAYLYRQVYKYAKIFVYQNSFENLVLKQRKQNFCVCIIIICKKN